MNFLSISEGYRYQFVIIRQFGKVTFWSIFLAINYPSIQSLPTVKRNISIVGNKFRVFSASTRTFAHK